MPSSLRLPPGFKHGVGLADAGHHAKEDFQLPALLARIFLLDGSQQHIRIGSVLVVQRVFHSRLF
jgi:hypothetical protein